MITHGVTLLFVDVVDVVLLMSLPRKNTLVPKNRGQFLDLHTLDS
jgi:hypothetical protein